MAWHSVNLSAINPSTDTALVLGGGPIGLAVIQTLVARGVQKIIVSEPSQQRASFARAFGAHHVLDPFVDDIPTKVRELTVDANGNRGVHIAYDAAGVQKGLDQAVQSLRARGLLVNIAVWEDRATFMPNLFAFKEKRYQGIVTYEPGDFEAVINAIADGAFLLFPLLCYFF